MTPHPSYKTHPYPTPGEKGKWREAPDEGDVILGLAFLLFWHPWLRQLDLQHPILSLGFPGAQY